VEAGGGAVEAVPRCGGGFGKEKTATAARRGDEGRGRQGGWARLARPADSWGSFPVPPGLQCPSCRRSKFVYRKTKKIHVWIWMGPLFFLCALR